ncbi:MAG: alpha/beta fold hydrolase [Bdellovibrionaceae bacterium]|nr:alpha/beta fold hydrolase [Pseudobdellovibrionaceae bacterium]
MTQQELLMRATQLGLKTLDRTVPSLAAAWAESIFLTPQHHPRPSLEEKIWKQGRPIELSSGNALRVYGSGRRLVFVHGWESRGSAFADWVEPLTSQGFQIALWDVPAHGDSPGKRINMVAASRALQKDLQEWDRTEASPLYALIGHSFGGCTCLFSQTTGSLRPEKTVTLGSPSNVRGVITRSADQIGFSPRAKDLFLERLQKTTGLRIDEGDFRLQGSRVPSKLLVIHDKKDKEISFQEGLELHSSVPHSGIHATEGLGHRRILRDNDVVKVVGEFLIG